MGRGGGSHGGGGHLGGRSFGGRSGGGFGRKGRGPGGPGFGGPPPRGPWFGGPRRRGFRPVFGRSFYGWGGPGGRFGCSTSIFIIILLIFIFGRFLPDSSSSRNETEIAVSRTERTAVTGTTTYKEWYLDELNFIDHDTDLTDGLKYFYSHTGIQPYVMLLDYNPSIWIDGKWNETAAEKFLAQIYEDTFPDNGHMIFAYFACENDSEDMNGEFYLYYGSAAYSVMDKEAETIFWSYFDRNYNNLDLSIAEFIGQTFRETADNIMHVEKSGDSGLFKAVTVFSVICVVVIIAAIIIVKKINKTEKL